MRYEQQKINVSPAERQILEHPSTLKAILSILVPFISIFNIYVLLSGRVWAFAVLSFQLIGFVGILLVERRGLPDMQKLLVYRRVFGTQILVFGIYLLAVIGLFHQVEVSPWSFVFIFLLSLWMPDFRGVSIALAFNFGIAGLFLYTGMDAFLIHKEYLIRFYVTLVIFSLLNLSSALVRRTYLTRFFAAREELKASEHEYKLLSRKLSKEIRSRDKMEKRLHHAIKMETVGRVAAGVAHDLNNILSGIVTYPDMLLVDMKRSDPLRPHLEAIRASGLKASAIVEDLLALSRRGVPVAEPMDLRKITDAYLESPEHLRFMESREAVTISAEYGEDLRAVVGSPVHLSKTIMNLVTNAVEALPGPGKIRIRIDIEILEQPRTIEHPVQGYAEIPAGEYMVFSISDNGVGIDPSEIESVFEPFFTRKQMGRSGTGLGMALVLGTVNDHRGFIRMDSQPGAGTRVDLFFPAAGPVPEETAESEDARFRKGGRERILVVDDEPLQLDIACSLLGRLGYRVDRRESGEAGLEFLERNRVDLVILDIKMEPGMDGVTACERILEKHPGQKVLFATGFSDKVTLDRARELGRGPCLFKPYTQNKMGRMVRERLDAGTLVSHCN